jgi:integrase/recombinase XerC/integrase/recombinase XerD
VEGKSPQTLRGYTDTLRRFWRALAEDEAPVEAAAIRAEHIYAYLGRYTHLTLETRHRYFREVRCFFNWTVEAGHLPESPCRGIRAVRVPERIIQPFSVGDVALLLRYCDVTTAVGARDRAIVLTLLDCGLRCSELAQLTLSDVSFDTRRLRILHAKGNKQRVVSFADRCAEALIAYVQFRGEQEGPLFVAGHGSKCLRAEKPLKSNGVKHMLRRLAAQAGVTKVHAHRFRHTFATWAIQNEARELDVQYLLGHSTADMVRRYSSSYRSEQAAARHASFSPADRMLGT